MLKKRFFKTKTECEVSFELKDESAEQVALVCDFNDWDPIPMKKNKNGTFRAKMRFPKDQQFQFRYLVNGGSWVNDETADSQTPNKFGGINSVLDTTAQG